MKLKYLFIISFFSISFFVNAQNVTESNLEVPFQKAKNYFVKNNYPENGFEIQRIESKEKLDSIFGMATLMGIEGKPTEIDFSTSYAIALINDGSKNSSKLNIHSIKKNQNRIEISFYIETTEEQPSTSRFFDLIIIDKRYKGTIHANYFNPNSDEQLTGADLDEFGCKGSAGYAWSSLKNSCIHTWEYNHFFLKGLSTSAVIFSDNKSEAELIGFDYQDYPENIVLKKNGNSWSDGNLNLEFKDDSYILKDKEVVIAQGK